MESSSSNILVILCNLFSKVAKNVAQAVAILWTRPYQPMHQTPPSEPQVLDTCSWQTHSYILLLICLHPCNCNYWRHVKTLEMTCLLLPDICRGASIHPLLLELLNICIHLWIIFDPLIDLHILLWVFTHPLSFTMLQTGCLCLNSCLYLHAMNVCDDFVIWGKPANHHFWWTDVAMNNYY